MGHKSIRSLMAGLIHQVWSDYKLATKTDEFYEGYKFGTSRSAARQHIGTPTTIIEHFRLFLDQTGRKTFHLQYFRTDAGTAFTSSEFKDFLQAEKFPVTFAAPHHQEQKSISERY
eukprot:3753642-Ditylum_brightwellii.AAC.1